MNTKSKDINVYVLTYRQEELSWRWVVFLPFNFYWRMFMTFSCSMYFSLVIFEEIFIMSETWGNVKTITLTLKIINMIYFSDSVLSLLHKTWESVQKSMPYQPKTNFQLLINVLSMLPTRFVIKQNFLNRDGSVNWLALLRMNGCLRMYNVFRELINLQQKMGINPVISCVVQHNALMFTIALLLSSLWYSLGYTLKSTGSWLADLERYTIGVNSKIPSNIFAFSLQQIYVTLCNQVTTDVRITHTSESLLWTFTLFIGFILKYGYIVSNMMMSLEKYQFLMYKIKEHLIVNKRCLHEDNYKKELKEYYTLFWKNWYGLHKCPLLNTFPLCLQKDILTDVYWDAIDHSHILRHFSVNIKRNISLVMESKFMQPGDYIFRKGEQRNCYYYIASGVVQIMSRYDGVSPILTIASGSCLGGLSLTLPSISPTDVICATVCEVRFLTYKNFRKALIFYSEGTQILFKVEKEHITHAKMMFILSKAYKKENPMMKMYGVPQDDKLKWIKHRWRKINEIERLIRSNISDKQLRKIIQHYLPIEMTHTSRYLDVIVLSSEVKWNADKCCLRSACPFILEPTCNFIKVWLFFIVTIVTIDCILAPFCIAFMEEYPEFLIMWEHAICFVYLFDIYSQAITAVRTVDKNITESMPLLRHHLKSMMFLIDILGSIPIRAAYNLFYLQDEIPSYLALNRLLKLVRVITFFQYKYSIITSSIFITHFLKYTYILFFFTYLSACFAFMLECKLNGDLLICTGSSWYENLVQNFLGDAGEIIVQGDKVVISNSKKEPLMYLTNSIYHLLPLLLGTGLINNPPIYALGIIFLLLIVFFTNNIFIFLFSESITMWIMTYRRQLLSKQLTISLKSTLAEKNFHVGLLNMLSDYAALQWSTSLGIKQDLEVTKTADIVSPILGIERRYNIIQAMKRVPLFSEFDSTINSRICDSFRVFTVPENFIFCRSGEHPMSFNIIIKGHCNLTSMLKEDMYAYPNGKIIGPGNCFPLMESLLNIPSFQTTCSVTICKIATIEVYKLRKILFSDYTIKDDIKTAANFNVSDLDIVVSKKKYRRETTKILSYILFKNDIEKIKEQLKKPVSLKMFKILLNLVYSPPFIINPCGQFLFIWETLKVIQIIATLLYIPAMFLLMCEENLSKFSIAIILDIVSLSDVIVRSYVGHYDKNGLLVNRNLYYISHSFAVDLISSIPSYLFVSHYSYKTKFFVSFLNKLLQIYRISGYINALCKKFDINQLKSLYLNFFIHFLLISLLLANCIFVYTCYIDCSNGSYRASCGTGVSWISSKIELNIGDSPYGTLFFCFYLIIILCSGQEQSAFHFTNRFEQKFALFISIIACASKCYFITKAASYFIGKNINFTKYRDNVKLYWMFIKNEGGGKIVASKIEKHFTFKYKKTKGVNMNKFVNTLHPSLQSDMTFAVYYQSMLCLHQFVGDSKAFMKAITNKVKEIYFLEETVVIDCKEVNDVIYFIHDGQIIVFDEDDEFVKILEPGSMFGSFNSYKKTKHKLKFFSKYHTSLLHIKSQSFIEVLDNYNHYFKQRFFELTFNKEYVDYDIKSENNENNDQVFDIPKHSFFYKGSKFYQWSMFLLSIVVPYLTMYPLLFSFVAIKGHIYYASFIYILDVISLFRIFIQLNATYNDKKTGIYISNLKVIRSKYFKNPTEFFLDLSSIFPFEIIGYLIFPQFIKWLRINRLLKMVILIKFSINHADKTYVKPWFRWHVFIAIVTLLPFTFVCLWLYFACSDGCNKLEDGTMHKIYDQSSMFSYSLVEIIHLFTFSKSYHLMKPFNTTECILMIIVVFVTFFIFPIIIGTSAQYLDLTNYYKKLYEYQIHCMKLYLQKRDLSKSLLEKLWDYCLLLWTTNNGRFIPHCIQEAPKNMKCNIFYDLYGGHVKYNALFVECNQNFLFQLSGKLNRVVYFPGDFIVKKFDVDDQMYFINSGEVEAVEFDELNKEIVTEVYITGQCFGLSQGLYERLPHLSTYKARSTVELLTLARNNWDDLRVAFPEDETKIYKMARKLSITTEVN